MNAGADRAPRMQDVAVELKDRPGALAELGEALGRAGISIEGGGAWVVNSTARYGVPVGDLSASARRGNAHFLFRDGYAARAALEDAGIRVLAVRDVIVQRLNQDEPGQLGKLTRRIADAGLNIEVLYSDHANQLILVVDDEAKGRAVAEAWMRDSMKRRLATIRVEP